jgi:probable HAF family extracellular repeat protein
MNSNRDVIGRIQHLAAGQVVSVNAFLWQGGADRAHEYTIEWLTLIDINDAGQMIGITQSGDEWTRPSFIVSADGTRVSLGGINGLGTFAAAINNAGHITGNAWVVAVQEYHAFIWADGVMNDLGAMNGSSTIGWSINMSDEVVGTATTTTALRAFRYADSKYTDLGSLGGASSGAGSINDAGQIVGWSTLAGEEPQQQRAFLYFYEKMYDLNDMIEPLPVPLTFAMKINNRGQILAMACATTTNDGCRYYLLTPVTSP